MALGEMDRPCSRQQLSDLIGIESRNAVPTIDALVGAGAQIETHFFRSLSHTDRAQLHRNLLAVTSTASEG